MNIARFIAILVVTLPSLLLTHAVLADNPPFVPRQALVRLRAGASIAVFNARYQTSTVDSVPSRGLYLLELPANPDEPQFVSDFLEDPDVVFADVNYVADDTNTGGSTQDIFLASTRIDYDSDSTPGILGLSDAHTRSLGVGMIVAVIDSGVDTTHPDLSTRIAPGGFDFLTNSSTIADPGPGRFTGHGTIIAGLIARAAPGARVLPIRILDTAGQSTTFLIARGIYHAIDNGAHVVNVSLGTAAENQDILRLALQEAETRNVLVVAAAGNDNVESPPRFPAGFTTNGAVSVTAVNAASVRAPFSNYGPWVTFSAPGVSVVGPVPGGGYGRVSGTSFAAPHVSGIAALVKSRCPGLTNAELRQRLQDSALPINQLNPGFEDKLGVRVNAARAVGIGFSTLPCACPADFDANLIVTVDDIFSFLGAWFQNQPDADADGSGSVQVQDVFVFLEMWFSGCP